MVCVVACVFSLTLISVTSGGLDSSHFHQRSFIQERRKRHHPVPEITINDTCPTWFWRDTNSTDSSCICTNNLVGMVHCDNHSHEVLLVRDFCMTYEEEEDKYYVGSCPYSYYHNYTRGLNIEIRMNRSELNSFMCGGLNRKGLLCGQCMDGYGVSPYSVQRNCTHCSNSVGWGWYILIDFICQTIFFAILFVSRISVTSPALNAFVLYAQISTTVNVNALYSLIVNSPELRQFEGLGTFCLFVLNVWKLEFFVLIAPPQCLSASLSSLGSIAIRYVSAFYPLLLILLLYVCIRIRDCRCRPIVVAWKPFHKCHAKLKQYYKLDQPVTKAFATVFLLSYVRIADVSYSLLLPTQLYNSRGVEQSSRAWYYDARVELFGPEHVGYGILAIVVLFTYIFIPPLLLFFYSFKLFQQLLSKVRYGRNSLKIFMDVMQSHYKDGLDGTRDLRSFSAVYFIARLIFIMIRLLTVFHNWHYSILSLLFLSCALLVLVLRPYKKRVFNYIDAFLLCILALEFHIYFLAGVYSALAQDFKPSLYKLFYILGFSPILYFLIYLCYHMFIAIKFPAKWKMAFSEKLVKLKKRLVPIKPQKYSRMSELDLSIDVELPDRCIRPELYDTFISRKEFNDGPATI